MKQIHINYSGRVQGVGFRYTAKSIAIKCCLKGWVKNLPDGSVEVVAQGQEDDLRQFIEELETEFKGYIRNKKIYESPPSGYEENFDVIY